MKPRDTTIAVAGNTFLAQSIRRHEDPRFLTTVERMREADVTLANLECSIPDAGTPPAYVAGSGWAATYMVGSRTMLDDLRYMGIDGVCAANNHVSDFGDAGILSTIRTLHAAEMPFAGIGASLTEASQAGYVEAPTGLRVAFLTACDWGPRGSQGLDFPWPVGYLPSDDVPPFSPRPGVNLLRYTSVSHVSTDQLEQLRKISADLGWEKDKVYRRNGFWRSHPLVGTTTNLNVEIDSETELWFLGRKFVADGRIGHHTEPCDEDLERLYKHIREARRQADVVLVGLHDQSHGEHVHEYISTFAHGAIDAGADVYFNNGGSHMGIEIYRGKAILYGVPNFFLQTEAVLDVPSTALARYGLPPDATAADYLDERAACARRAFEEGGPIDHALGTAGGSALHVCVFDEHAALKEVRVEPIEPLGGTIFGPTSTVVPRFRRQLPLMPEPDSAVARGVLDHVVEASRILGTDMEVRDGVGIVHCG